jgi:enamine deaminase RidA (YjgF/YER057c/UK114 family)
MGSVGDAMAHLGKEAQQEGVLQLNHLLKLLQDAGYNVGEVEMEVSVPPKTTIKLKTTSLVTEEKLNAVLLQNKDHQVFSAILMALIQANRYRNSVGVEGLELNDLKIEINPMPKITLQWNEKGAATAAAA